MGNINILLQIPSDQLPIYLVSILVVSFIGVIMVSWFNNKFEKVIEPLCKKISERRAKVVAREKKELHKNKRKKF